MTPNLCVIANLDVSRVTWAPQFVAAAQACDIPVKAKPLENWRNLFIGDSLPTKIPPKSIYFLAAYSGSNLAQRLEPDVLREHSNIDSVNLTLVVSSQEYVRLKLQKPSSQVMVNGFPVFPVDAKLNREFKKTKRKVCFIAQERPVKNFEFEYELIPALRLDGFEVVHLSPTALPSQRKLESLGATVHINPTRASYWQILDSSSHFISTSMYESLGVSGLEAAKTDCLCITPDCGGFKDWSPNRYKNYTVESVFEKMRSAQLVSPRKLSWYSSKNYFNRLCERLQT